MPNRIRSITASDIADLIWIADETNLNPWSAQNYIDELQTDGAVMLAVQGEAPRTIGFIVGRIVPSAQEGSDAEIYNIAITKGEQNKGNGRLLLESFLSVCAEREVEAVWLEVRESNQKAIDFYAKNGFEPIQKRNNFYDNPPEHAILMKLSLKNMRLENLVG